MDSYSLNASKVAAKLWKLLEAEMNPQSNNEWMLEIMGTIGTFWRAMENLEEAKKVFAKQLKIQAEQQGGWIFTAMELAEIELELENLVNCREIKKIPTIYRMHLQTCLIELRRH